MAGRPKMMARRVWDLKERFEALISEFNRLCPEIYQPRGTVVVEAKTEDDVIRYAWQEARKAVEMVEYDMDFLASMLHAKARTSPPLKVPVNSVAKGCANVQAKHGS